MERGIPIVLDPVGVGATNLRTSSALRLLAELRVTAIRGNASEVGTLVGVAAETRAWMRSRSQRSARWWRAKRPWLLAAPSPSPESAMSLRTLPAWLSSPTGILCWARFTGSGCMSTTMVAAFAAVEPDAWLASTAALSAFGLAGEIAAPRAGGPGTFRSHLLDAVANLDAAALEQGQKVSLL